ncbi:MAG: hypothetical protein Q4A00_05385 [Flavobacteriaceae bacterium]|nr:hypothetical protein [Flavobacteriaceae bacterium]
MSAKKIVLGQFFTKDSIWLRSHIKDFIEQTKCNVAYDPFAGEGHLLNAVQSFENFEAFVGLDIDDKLKWEHNDSLINIPKIDNAIAITNPPYISKYSASRKGVGQNLKKYFENSVYDDVYLIALDKLLQAQNNVVAIIPETFINSNYQQKNKLVSITILEENPFEDTENPVIVACFDGKKKDYSEIKVYKNDTYVNTLENLEKMRLIPNNSVKMKFNDKQGWLAVRCVDTTNPNDMLKFDFKENIDYDWEKGIKVSSRLLTLINIDIPKERQKKFINCCNEILQDTREKTDDIIFSPFKGNMKNGRRRRRLDFLTCRAIVEKSYYEIIQNDQLRLF